MRIIERREGLYFFLGTLGLLIGTLVYLIDRNPEHIYFISHSSIGLSLYHALPNFFGPLGNSLPTFLHPFSFILLTAGITTYRRRNYITICLFWFGINVLFELGQKYKIFSTTIIPNWFSGIPYLENSRDYFLHGTFDFIDVWSIMLGTVTAYLVLLITTKEERTCSTGGNGKK